MWLDSTVTVMISGPRLPPAAHPRRPRISNWIQLLSSPRTGVRPGRLSACARTRVDPKSELPLALPTWGFAHEARTDRLRGTRAALFLLSGIGGQPVAGY